MNKIADSIKGFLKSRNLKYGTNSVILIAVVIAIAVVVNLLVGMADIKVDLTPNKLYSLSDTTKDILKNLDKDVTIYGLFDDGKISAGDDYKEVVELLNQYSKYPRVKVEYVDPDKNPGLIKDLDPSGTKNISKNDFVVKSGDKLKKLGYYDLFNVQFNQRTFMPNKTASLAEMELTGAIKYVTSDKTPIIYFTQGHGEGKLDSEYSNLKAHLERNNYEVKSINLATQSAVPEDAEMLMIVSPKSDLSADERSKINEYIKNGGKAMFMFDFLESDPSFDEFEKLLSDYNVSINYDKIREEDENRHLPDNPYAVVLDVKASNIVPQDFNVLLANSRSINILKNQKSYVTVTSLIKTSDKAIGEQVDKSRGEDLKGPLDVAVAVEYKGGPKTAKLIVMGNGYFISDEAAQAYGIFYERGASFYLYSLNWLLEKKDDVVIQPKTYDVRTIDISSAEAGIMSLVVVVLIPLVILGTGTFVYLRRRHL